MQASLHQRLNRLRISAVARLKSLIGMSRPTVLIGCESQPSPDGTAGGVVGSVGLNRLRISAVARFNLRNSHADLSRLNRLRISAVAQLRTAVHAFQVWS